MRERRSIRWMLFQALVAFPVFASNIHYQWTPNPVVVSALAFFAAGAATWVAVSIIDLLRFRREMARRLRSEQRVYNRRNGRVPLTGG